MKIDQKYVNAVGLLGVVMACLMFGSYVDQIMLNWAGKTGSLWLGPTTVLNCAAWVFYGLCKTDRDWKIAAPNILGVVLGFVVGGTAFLCKSSCSVR
ncbi:MAG: SemiSWEET family transporter [Patescibacteria group bacterium]